MLKQDSGR